MSGPYLDALARQHLWRAGLNYEHGTGHGVGHFLGVHEGPISISSNPDQVRAARRAFLFFESCAALSRYEAMCDEKSVRKWLRVLCAVSGVC